MSHSEDGALFVLLGVECLIGMFSMIRRRMRWRLLRWTMDTWLIRLRRLRCLAKGSEHRWFYARAVPSNGVEHEWTPTTLASQLGPAGHRRMVLRSDKEPSPMALKRRVGLMLTNEYGQEIVAEEPALGVSQDTGLAEHAVREIKAKVRSLPYVVKLLLGQAVIRLRHG